MAFLCFVDGNGAQLPLSDYKQRSLETCITTGRRFNIGMQSMGEADHEIMLSKSQSASADDALYPPLPRYSDTYGLSHSTCAPRSSYNLAPLYSHHRLHRDSFSRYTSDDHLVKEPELNVMQHRTDCSTQKESNWLYPIGNNGLTHVVNK